MVEKSGQEQIVLLDALDFRLLLALAHCAVSGPAAAVQDSPEEGALRGYLTGEISLSKAAERLSLSRFELQERFDRLGVPLRLSPSSLEEARSEVIVARSLS